MKNELRKKYLLVRKNISNKTVKDQNILNKVLSNNKIKEAKVILCYVSNSEEVDTINLIIELLKTKVIAVPKIEDKKMNFYIIKSIQELKEGYYGILEPISINLLTDYSSSVSITPGICFDYDGYRLGYGKGFYDYFYSLHPHLYKIGLCYKECLLDKINREKFDVKVDEIITD